MIKFVIVLYEDVYVFNIVVFDLMSLINIVIKVE